MKKNLIILEVKTIKNILLKKIKYQEQKFKE